MAYETGRRKIHQLADRLRLRPPLRGSRDSQVYSAGNEEYETSKMAYCDIKNSVDTAKREGIAEGMEIGMAKGKQEGLAEGMEKGMNQKAEM